MHSANPDLCQARALLQPILPRQVERLLIQPADLGIECAGDAQLVFHRHDQVAARSIDIAIQHNGDAVAGLGLFKIAIERNQARNAGRDARWRYLDLIARAQYPAGTLPRITAEIPPGAAPVTYTPLNKHTRRPTP